VRLVHRRYSKSCKSTNVRVTLRLAALPLATSLLALLAFGCKTRVFNEGSAQTEDIGPYKSCAWVYADDGLVPFKNAATHAGFDAKFNPFLTSSRRGLTVRVVGTLTDEFVSSFDEDTAKARAAIEAKFPYVTFIKQTAVHEPAPEDRNVSRSKRVPKGEITKTTIVALPENSVMIVYPVSIAAPGFNTLAGQWIIDDKVREQPSKPSSSFGKFPFLLFTGRNEHAFHGPITPNSTGNMWRVKRGAVSRGCHRMQGEHVVELAVLLGCGKDPRVRRCSKPDARSSTDDERVYVLEEFDYVPRPELTEPLPEGEYTGSWEDILRKWVVVDVDYPREAASPHLALLTDEKGVRSEGYLLEKSEFPRAFRNENPTNKPFAWRRFFPIWDNRDRPLVKGVACVRP
jgi:hypothetical protein